MDASALSTAFAVWAAVVGMIGAAIVWELARLRSEVRQMNGSLANHVVATEHRVTAIETHLNARDGFNPNRYFGQGK